MASPFISACLAVTEPSVSNSNTNLVLSPSTLTALLFLQTSTQAMHMVQAASFSTMSFPSFLAKTFFGHTSMHAPPLSHLEASTLTLGRYL